MFHSRPWIIAGILCFVVGNATSCRTKSSQVDVTSFEQVHLNSFKIVSGVPNGREPSWSYDDDPAFLQVAEAWHHAHRSLSASGYFDTAHHAIGIAFADAKTRMHSVEADRMDWVLLVLVEESGSGKIDWSFAHGKHVVGMTLESTILAYVNQAIATEITPSFANEDLQSVWYHWNKPDFSRQSAALVWHATPDATNFVIFENIDYQLENVVDSGVMPLVRVSKRGLTPFLRPGVG